MRFALVALDFGTRLLGVDNALAGQAKAALDTGTPMDAVVVNATREGVDKDVRYLRYRSAAHGTRFERLERFTKARLLASVRELDDYDVIFLRYPTAVDVDPLALLRTTRAKVATVHHAKEVREQLAVSRSPGMLVRAGAEWLQGRRVLRRVDGIVGVTDEIRDYQKARSGRSDVPTATVANGVDVSAVKHTRFRPFDGRTLRLVFLASSHAPWHGVDRLRRSLESYRGDKPVILDMVGLGGGPAGTEEHFGSVTIRHHGLLRGEALDAVLADATVAVSTLAFFRTGLRQAAVLKTREYVARGIPVVLGYEDVDISENEPFVLQLPNDDSSMSIEALFAFAERVSKDPDLADRMRAFATNVLDWRVKVRLFDAFARRLQNSP